jgi:hypothetical protein
MFTPEDEDNAPRDSASRVDEQALWATTARTGLEATAAWLASADERAAQIRTCVLYC